MPRLHRYNQHRASSKSPSPATAWGARDATTTSSCAMRWFRMQIATAFSSSDGALICRKREASAAMRASWPAYACRLLQCAS